jgi:hypothetical protein
MDVCVDSIDDGCGIRFALCDTYIRKGKLWAESVGIPRHARGPRGGACGTGTPHSATVLTNRPRPHRGRPAKSENHTKTRVPASARPTPPGTRPPARAKCKSASAQLWNCCTREWRDVPHEAHNGGQRPQPHNHEPEPVGENHNAQVRASARSSPRMNKTSFWPHALAAIQSSIYAILHRTSCDAAPPHSL